MRHTPGMVEPTLCLLVHSKTPDDLLIKGCQLTSLGGGYPMFINDDVIVDNLLSRGTLGGPPVPLDIARRYGSSSGCIEPTVNNMDSDFTQTRLNAPQVLVEAILGHGYIYGYCYTQLTDIEQEQNGIYNYDRTPKFDMAIIHDIFSRDP